MLKQSLFLVLLFLVGCTAVNPNPSTPTFPAPPDSIPITDDNGATIATQPEGLWVLLSGVDDHGQLVEHELTLFAQPDVEDGVTTTIHSGTAVAVYEIRQAGPQGLRRFYRVQAVDGTNGWIAEYYVRRVSYVFDAEDTAVSLFDAPDGQEIAQLDNVTPVTIKDPTAKEWWQVQTVAGEQMGWVKANYVKESPEPEFLVNQQHPHEP